jgi:hypothetical protein
LLRFAHKTQKIGFQPIFYPTNRVRTEGTRSSIIGDFCVIGGAKIHKYNRLLECQQVKDSQGAKNGVGVAENPRSGVGARGSSVKKAEHYGKICYTLPSIALPLLNFLTLLHRYNKLPSPWALILPQNIHQQPAFPPV